MTSKIQRGRAAGLAYEQQGDGDVLVLVHGFPLDRSMWVHQRDALSETHRVIVPDLQGFGESIAWDSEQPLTMWRHADDLAAMLDALEIREPVWLAGLSMGGYVAWQFWRRHRDRLKGLGLLDTKAAPDDAAAQANREQTALKALAGKTAELATGMLPKLLAPTSAVSAEDLSRLKQTLKDVAPSTFAAALRGMALRDDARPWLPTIDVPCLVVCGAEDVISPVSEMREFAAQLPNARFVEVAGAGHMSPIEQPAAVNAAFRQWLN